MAQGRDDDTDAGDEVPGEPRPVDTTTEAVARGRASETPFVLLGGVALVIWAIVALVAAVLLVLWWLA